jgi:hypothetical protein
MQLASFLFLLAMPQAQGDTTLGDIVIVVESSCTKESKGCKVLFRKEDLPKGKECSTPEKGLKWVVPESVPKEHLKEAKALAEKANKGELKGLCLEDQDVFYR